MGRGTVAAGAVESHERGGREPVEDSEKMIIAFCRNIRKMALVLPPWVWIWKNLKRYI
jgi:uncharacterized protein YifE (UPF0438 family)